MQKKVTIGIIIIVILAASWYWGIRPQQVKRQCNAVGVKHLQTDPRYMGTADEIYNLNYTACMHKHGL